MRRGLVAVVAGAVVAGVPAAARAQQAATVREIVQVVKTGSAAGTELTTAKIGTPVAAGDRVRTGGRSAAGLRFQDRSLLRLGELTEVVLTGAGRGSVQVRRGQVLADYRRPSTISGGYAVAAIRGTHVEMRVDEESKVADVRCYKGRVFVSSTDNPIVAGTTESITATTLTDPQLQGLPVDWTGAELRFVDGPFDGEKRRVTAYDAAAGTITFDPALPARAGGGACGEAALPAGVSGYLLVRNLNRRVVELRNNMGTTVHPRRDPDRPFNVPHEKFSHLDRRPIYRQLRAGRALYAFPGTDQHWKMREEYFGERRAIQTVTPQFRDTALRPDICDLFGPVASNGQGSLKGARHGSALGIRTVGASLQPQLRQTQLRAGSVAAAPAALAGSPGPTLGGRPGTDTTPGDLATGEAQFVPEYVRPDPVDVGRRGQIRFEPFGLATTDANYSLGSRVRLMGSQGDLYVEAGYRYAIVNDRLTHEASEGFLNLRGRHGDFTAGRQHLYLRMANNQTLGTLLGLETSDAITYELPLEHTGIRQQVGYIFDTEALDPGGFKAAFARGLVPVGNGVVGYSVMGSPENDRRSLGWSLDAAQPVIRNVLDLYGEGGKDTQGRTLATGGLYVPALYHLAKVDMFLEYGHRQGFDDRYSLRFRRELGSGLLAVAFVDRISGQGYTGGGGLVWSMKFR